jgi:hypothetical protein
VPPAAPASLAKIETLCIVSFRLIFEVRAQQEFKKGVLKKLAFCIRTHTRERTYRVEKESVLREFN